MVVPVVEERERESVHGERVRKGHDEGSERERHGEGSERGGVVGGNRGKNWV